MKSLLTTLVLSLLMAVNCYANTCQKPGDIFQDGATNSPVLMETTAYYQGYKGSHGDVMREGYCAGDPDLYGASVAIYKAETSDDGYEIGEFIGYFEMRDTGYGYSTGEGHSEVRSDKKYAGTIESGIHLDIYRTNLARCWDWMHLTNGKVFAVIVPNVKG